MSSNTLPNDSGSTANNPNITVRENTTGSHNTTNNSRVYENAKHNEYNNPTFYDYRRVGNTTNVLNRDTGSTFDDLKKLEMLVEADADWDFLLRHLSIADQDAHRSDITFDLNEPNYFWITKNIDFTQWTSDVNPQALHICGPHHRGMREVSSHTVDRAKEAAVQSGEITLYYFSSTTPAGREPASVFAHTLLCQIASGGNAGRMRSITVGFLKTLFRKVFQQGLLRFKEGDSLSAAVGAVLGSSFAGRGPLWGSALVGAIREAHVRISSITIDGIDDDVLFQNAIFLVKHIMSTNLKFKALLLGPLSSALSSNPLDFLSRIEYDKERKECLRSLQHEDTRYDNISEEHDGSLEWFWNHTQYLQWSRSAASSLLYIQGKPGSGKSTLAKYFQKNLFAKDPRARTSTVVYYFYTLRGKERESTHDNMLRSILYHLLDKHESAFFLFQQQFRRTCGEWPCDSLKQVLSSFASYPSETPLYLILDAMDESEEKDRQDFVQLLCELCSNNNVRSNKNRCIIKVLLASRPIAELQGRIDHIIRMQDENTGDIQKFVNTFLTRSTIQLSGPVLVEAERYIIKNAEGVFVWVRLVKAELLRIAGAGYDDRQIMDHLKDLPKELEEFYELMLKKLHGGSPVDIQNGITLFQFVRFSARPMQIAELQHVLAIQDYSDGLSPPSHLEFKERLSGSIEARIAHCGGNFLEINANNTVQLMHQTAQEFLLRIEREKRDSRFKLNRAGAHREIATTSVRYLMTCFGSTGFSKIKTWEPKDFQAYAHYLGEWPLIKYAIENLKHHYDLCGHQNTVRVRIKELVQHMNQQLYSRFLGDWFAEQFGTRLGNPVRIAGRTLANFSFFGRTTPKEFGYKILDIAAAEEQIRVFETMIGPCTHFDVQAQRETPLILCARMGLVDALRMCLSSGADVNATGTKGRTALHQAAESGNVTIVKLLLMGNADEEIKDKDGVSALDLALKKFPVYENGCQRYYPELNRVSNHSLMAAPNSRIESDSRELARLARLRLARLRELDDERRLDDVRLRVLLATWVFISCY